jgi:hypothetical protein
LFSNAQRRASFLSHLVTSKPVVILYMAIVEVHGGQCIFWPLTKSSRRL